MLSLFIFHKHRATVQAQLSFRNVQLFGIPMYDGLYPIVVLRVAYLKMCRCICLITLYSSLLTCNG